MNINIREYENHDKAMLISCMEGLQQHIVDIDPLHRQIISIGYGEKYTDELLKNIKERKGKIYLAEIDSKVIGCIAGNPQPEPKGGTLEVVPTNPAWIRELYVDSEYRGRGIGTLLMDKLEEYFKVIGCDVVQVGVFAPNLDTHNFYKTKGYVDRDITMLKKIN